MAINPLSQKEWQEAKLHPEITDPWVQKLAAERHVSFQLELALKLLLKNKNNQSVKQAEDLLLKIKEIR